MKIGKRVVGHEKQLHEVIIPSKRIVARSPTSSCEKLRANLKKGTDVSISNISRRLSKEFGLNSCKPAKNKADTPNEKEEARVCLESTSLDF